MKKLVGLLLVAGAAVATIAYLTREQMLPAPSTPPGPAPKYRTGIQDTDVAVEDLTELKGIGPTFAARLAEMSILTRADLLAADPRAVADSVGTSVGTVETWQAAANQ